MKFKDVTNEQIEWLVTLFFGWLGIHKFMKKE